MKTVIAIVIATITILGGQMLSSYKVQAEIASLGFRMDAKEKQDTQNVENAKSLADAERRTLSEWRSSIEKRIDQVERDYKLADYDLKNIMQSKR